MPFPVANEHKTAARRQRGRVVGRPPALLPQRLAGPDVQRLELAQLVGRVGMEMILPPADTARAAAAEPALDRAEERLRREVAGIDGALVERKKFAIAVHYRLVADDQVARVESAVAAIAAEITDLRRTAAKKVFALRPRVDWDKGRAVLWLLTALGLDREDVLPLYLGDDDTDEDAFAALKGRGLGILVTEAEHPTAADYVLANTEEVGRFLGELVAILGDPTR